ncbi:MAG: GNAT family N-acetyltransferase [Cyanobacteria bacterium LVE1205-1]|jgi:RimJ/RimL family protein N-acetyltransferase
MAIDEIVLSLAGKQTLLRSFCADDISTDYIDWLTDPEVVRFSNQRFRTHTQETALSYLNSFAGSGNLYLGIRLAETQRLVGTITAYRSLPHQTADMGLLIGDRTCWGKGIGLDAWNTLLDYLLNVCCLRKVTGGTLRCNIGMVRIMERSGMQLEAVRAQQELVDQVPQDLLYYAKFHSSIPFKC